MSFLTRPRTIWLAFFLTLTLTAIFGIVMQIWQFQIIDEMWNPAKITAHIEAMSPVQRKVHAWLTGTVDVLYPFAYTALFLGMAKKYFPGAGWKLYAPIVATIPFDLTEGLVQVLALNGYEAVIPVKAVVTPIKLILFTFGLIVFLCAVVRAMRRSRQ